MEKKIIKPVTTDGRITLPKKLREKYGIIDYVEISDTGTGLLVSKH